MESMTMMSWVRSLNLKGFFNIGIEFFYLILRVGEHSGNPEAIREKTSIFNAPKIGKVLTDVNGCEFYTTRHGVEGDRKRPPDLCLHYAAEKNLKYRKRVYRVIAYANSAMNRYCTRLGAIAMSAPDGSHRRQCASRKMTQNEAAGFGPQRKHLATRDVSRRRFIRA
jgi:hypothetical protein